MVKKNSACYYFRDSLADHFALKDGNKGYLSLLGNVQKDNMDWTDSLGWNEASFLEKIALVGSEVYECEDAIHLREIQHFCQHKHWQTELTKEITDVILRIFNLIGMLERIIPSINLAEVLLDSTVIDNRYEALNVTKPHETSYMYFIGVKTSSLCNYFRNKEIDPGYYLDIRSRLNQILYISFVFLLRSSNIDERKHQQSLDFINGCLVSRMQRNRNKVSDRLV